MEQALEILKTYWGYDSFRKHQWEIIEHCALNGKDGCVLFPTGFGKSLCYQLPGLLTKKTVIVISPLIALMNDQVKNLEALGIKSVALHSGNTDSESWGKARRGEYTIVYMAPERIVHWLDTLEQMVAQQLVCMVAVDEAHCVSSWGHDFRESYRDLYMIRDRCPALSIMTLTATATRRVSEDIIELLKLRDVKQVTTSFNRANLCYSVRTMKDKMLDLTSEVIGSDSCIIYCLKRDTTVEIADHLKRMKGIDARPYHAKLTDETRRKNHQDFVNDKLHVIVCTTAFGMGIDKPDIGTVINYGVPKSLEEYVQQTGRAGRDGSESRCILFTNSTDMNFIEDYIVKKDTKPGAQASFGAMKNFIYENSCRRTVLLSYFDENSASEKCSNCDNCTGGGKQAVMISSVESDVLDALKKFRAEQAASRALPSYTIFNQNTLNELSAKRPTTNVNLLAISCIGASKLKQFGAQLIEIITRICAAKGLETDVGFGSSTTTSKKRKTNNSALVTYEYHTSGMNVEQISKARTLAISTVVGHLEHVVEVEKKKLNWDLVPIGNAALAQQLNAVMRMNKKLSARQLQDKAGIPNNDMDWTNFKLIRLRYYSDK